MARQKIFSEVVEEIQRVVPLILDALHWPTFVTKGTVMDALLERGVNMPGHHTYMGKIVHRAILKNGYEEWSNLTGSRKYRTYHRIGAEENHVAGSTPASSSLEAREHA